MLRPRDKSLKLISGIDASSFSMVAITIFLTIWMIIVGHPMVTPGVSIDLSSPSFVSFVPLVVNSNNQVFPMNHLPLLIREQLARGSERNVYIKADAQEMSGNVSQLLLPSCPWW